MKTNIETTTSTITPVEAKLILDKNKGLNIRPFNPDRIERLVSDIKAGLWRTTHQGIAFNKSGELIDGQHRLAACVKAEIPIVIQVTKHLDDNTLYAIDCGLARSQSTRLNIEPRAIAMFNLFVQLAYGEKHKGHTEHTLTMNNFTGDVVTEFCELKKKRKGSTPPPHTDTAGFRAAACLHILNNPSTKGYVQNQYKAMITGDVDSMSVFIRTHFNQRLHSYANGALRMMEDLCKGMIIFDKLNSSNVFTRDMFYGSDGDSEHVIFGEQKKKARLILKSVCGINTAR